MRPPIDTEAEIRTPEFLSFRARVVGPTRRATAWLIDWLIYVLLISLFSLAVFSSLSLASSGLGTGMLLIINFVGAWFYFAAIELWTGGRSPAKILLKLRVLRIDGLPITWREALIRNLLRAVDAWTVPPVFFGPLVMIFDPYFRRLGDLAAGTIVISEAKPSAVRRRRRTPAPKPPPLALSGPAELSPHEREALELFSSRDTLAPAQRRELAKIVAPALARRHGLPLPEDPTLFLLSLYRRAEEEALHAPAPEARR